MSRSPASPGVHPAPHDSRVAIVVSRYNETLTSRLAERCRQALLDRRMDDDRISMSKVPGAFELPLAAKILANSRTYDAVICLGAVIRGETPHFEYVSSAAVTGILQAGLESGRPVIFGVLTCNTLAEAEARVGEGAHAGDKGYEAGMTAVDMILWRREFAPHG